MLKASEAKDITISAREAPAVSIMDLIKEEASRGQWNVRVDLDEDLLTRTQQITALKNYGYRLTKISDLEYDITWR